jgi:hypothetical protein
MPKLIKIQKNRYIGILNILLLCLAVSIASGFNRSKADTDRQGATQTTERNERYRKSNELSKAVLEVKNMTCSGCISSIKTGLSKIPGVKDITETQDQL